LYWWLRGRFAEGRRAMEAALAGPLPERTLARAGYVAGTLACGQADYGWAGERLAESIALFDALGDETGSAFARSSAGFAAVGRGASEEGVALLEDGVRLALGVGDGWAAAFMSCFLATVARRAGELERAADLGGRALRLARSVGDRDGAGMAAHLLAGLARDAGRTLEAAGRYQEGLRLAAQVGDTPQVAFCLQGLAGVEAEPGRAAWLFGAADVLLERCDAGGYLSRPDEEEVRAGMADVRARLGGSAFDRAWGAGREASPSEALATALELSVRRPASDPDGLTAREVEVLELIAGGRANKQIAAVLSISVSTVEQHVSRVYAKIGARGRADATAHALRRGVLVTR
jgi:DNA-binding CsgD family transcriptional regulator